MTENSLTIPSPIYKGRQKKDYAPITNLFSFWEHDIKIKKIGIEMSAIFLSYQLSSNYIILFYLFKTLKKLIFIIIAC